MALDAPEFALTPEQSEALAGATANVLACYDVGVSKKNAAWIELLMCAGGIYGGKVMAVSIRKRRARAMAAQIRAQEQAQTNAPFAVHQ